jgi:hypothetical protein
MGFRVYGYKSEEPEQFEDSDTWKVIEGGALEIWRQDGSKLVISPTRWASLETDPPPPKPKVSPRRIR